MRTTVSRSLAAASTAVALVSAAGGARAQQVDTNPPLPNVMLLIDNSGSMERMIDGNLPESDTPNNSCNCFDQGPDQPIYCPTWNQANPPSPDMNRWNRLQTVLTGDLQNGFNCVAMPRATGGTLSREYQIATKPPYDVNYYLPFHRMVARTPDGNGGWVGCVVAPEALPGGSAGQGVGENNAFLSSAGSADDPLPSGSLVAQQYGYLQTPRYCTSLSPATLGAVPGFAQWGDGAITEMRDLMRFGVMMFDSDPDPHTGLTAANTVGAQPFQGMWTYFLNWAADPTGASCNEFGLPIGCQLAAQPMAVGARNPGAPPWEGRLVGFPQTSDLPTQEKYNDTVSSVILASRPYGATPMAGLFNSAQTYLFKDPQGPQQDKFVQGGCRNEYIILLTDGAPNLDLEVPAFNPPATPTNPAPGCDPNGSPGCPFKLPQQYAAALYGTGSSSATQASVQTFVIGFAVLGYTDNGTPLQCSQWAKNGGTQTCNSCNLQTLAAQPNGACCELQCIAQSGGTTNAYFADNASDLQAALGSILAQIAKSTTTRTTPAYAPLNTNVLSSTTSPTNAESIYLASFNAQVGAAWSGDIQRQRYQCSYQSGSGFTVPPPTIQTAQGDDFAANLAQSGSKPRKFVVVVPQADSNGNIDTTDTIRPYAPIASQGDHAGNTQVTVYAGGASQLDTTIPYQALNLPPAGGCTYTSTAPGGAQKTLTPTGTCSAMLLDYLFGQPTFPGIPNDFNFQSRAGTDAAGHSLALGDIFHATPFVAGPPGSLLQDPGYVAFASPSTQANPYGWANRENIVYAATNDGLMHAFWADENQLENNERWAMLLPAVMPNLWSEYPSSHQFLLDGSPIVKDVVWDRLVTDAESGTSTVWHTMLVASYGPSQRGYYAIDVTDPDASQMTASAINPADPTTTMGPVFRWQLTSWPKPPATGSGTAAPGSSNMPLFGAHSSTPAVTTLFMNPDGKGARDIGVAILPGGLDVTPQTQASCNRLDTWTNAAYPPRTAVRCWGQPTGNPPTQHQLDFVTGRSVTIVRVDTGEILRVFARKQDEALYPNDTIASSTVNRWTQADFDSPMTSTPIVYPNDVGTDTTKFFVGDADGTIWRFDVSNPDPSQWPSPTLFLDLYNTTVDKSTTAWSDGQGFDVTPVLSLDPAGNLVLNAATGSIQTFDSTGTEYVYSITEKAGSSGFQANVNWWLQPAQITNWPGERVSGPMTVFDGVLYFSTYAAPAPGAQSCTTGVARLWGRDFITPQDSTNLSLGGKFAMQPPGQAQQTLPAYYEPDTADPTLQGKVIPGVSIKASPACASATSGSDQYVAGASHSTPQNFTPATYSLFTQVGAKGTNGSTTKQFEMSLPTPVSPTVIDSWAAVLE